MPLINEQLKKAAYGFFDKNEGTWTRVGESRNELLLHTTLPFVIKSSPKKENIEKEAYITQLFSEKFPEHISTILDKFDDNRGYRVLLMQSAGNRSFMELVKNNQYTTS